MSTEPLRDYLISLYVANDNTLTPAMVVDAARPEDSPIHDWFEWDNEKAADSYRLEQARALIRKVRIKFVTDEGEVAKIPQFVSVARPGGNSYTPIEEVREDPFTSQLVLLQAEREWRQLFARYRHLQQFLKMVGDTLNGESGE